jgi:hypothetical protein
MFLLREILRRRIILNAKVTLSLLFSFENPENQERNSQSAGNFGKIVDKLKIGKMMTLILLINRS